MGSYISLTDADRAKMLERIGIASTDGLFADIPEELKLKKNEMNFPGGMSESEVSAKIRAIAKKNKIYSSIFLGAGAYNHYIPSIVKSVASKEEFLTAYTPYQPEISQGILQSIFEYQTMICELTGMDISNASVYDGATAAAEAVAMCRDGKRSTIVISAASHPMVIETVKTYCFGADAEVIIAPTENGETDINKLSDILNSVNAACFYMQQPNFSGIIEDAEKISGIVHDSGAKFIMGVNPIAAALLKTPAECGADIAVGEGQPFGMPLAFGGPYLGFMACTQALMRKMPGRIVGEAVDIDGKRAFILTLQAREQHIRREKASSNICSNQALCALTAGAYLSAMGENGLRRVAELCYSKAHYAAEKISAIPGFGLAYNHTEFFHEFVTKTPGKPADILNFLSKKDILGGYPLDNGILWCVTEVNTKEQIDALVNALKEVEW